MAGAGTNFLEFWVKFFILGGAGINLDFWSGVWSLDFWSGAWSLVKFFILEENRREWVGQEPDFWIWG